MELVLPTGVQPAKSSVESAVPLAPGDGRLARAAGIEPNTSCLEDRHAAHYATPAKWNSRNGRARRRCSIRPALSVLHDPIDRDGIATGFARWRRVQGSNLWSRRTRRVSTALPYRSANSPNSNGALDWTRTSIGPFRKRLTIQLVHERTLEAPAGAAPAIAVLQTAAFLFRHGAIGCAHRNRTCLNGFRIRRLTARPARDSHSPVRSPVELFTGDWPSRQDSNLHTFAFVALLIQLSYGKEDGTASGTRTRVDRLRTGRPCR